MSRLPPCLRHSNPYNCATHLIGTTLLRADNFEGFFAARHRALLDVIGKAMGKTLEMDTQQSVDRDEPQEEDETDD